MTRPIQFKVAALVARPDADRIAGTLETLYHYLVNRGVKVLVERKSSKALKGLNPEVRELEALGEDCDFALIVGGDGTLLAAARTLAPFDIPLIGVNLGRLGFLADILPEHLEKRLGEVLDGRFDLEERFMLEAQIKRDEAVVFRQTAVNDVVIHRSSTTGMLEIVTHIDTVFLNSQRSDGLIISTPTGSTAYALSAGGPILSPSLQAIVLAPVNPHALSNRPIVVESECVIGISFKKGKQFGARLVCDNIQSPPIEVNDRIEVRKAARPFRLLHPPGYDFYEILRAKLNWSSGTQA